MKNEIGMAEQIFGSKYKYVNGQATMWSRRDMWKKLYDLQKENEQLKEQLAKKKKSYVKFIPCTCGCNRRHLWCGSPCGSTKSYWYYECVKCGFKSDKAPSADKAKLAWNKNMKDCHKQVEDFIKGDK